MKRCKAARPDPMVRPDGQTRLSWQNSDQFPAAQKILSHINSDRAPAGSDTEPFIMSLLKWTMPLEKKVTMITVDASQCGSGWAKAA